MDDGAARGSESSAGGPFVVGSRLTTRAAQVFAALDASRIGVWEWNVATGQTSFNAMWMAMIGYAPDELPQQLSTWQRLVHPDDVGPVTAALQAHLRGETDSYCTVHRLQHKDGLWIWVRDAGVITERDDAGAPLVLIGTHVEVTELKAVEAELVRARERAESSERAQARFLANMSHEIRTPMTGLLGVLDMLADTSLSASQRELVGVLDGAARQLHRLLDDVLEVVRLESGGVRLNTGPFSWRSTLLELVQLYRASASARDIDVRLLCHGDVDVVVSGDAVRVRQIVGNLLQNAIRFAPLHTPVTVTLGAKARDDDLDVTVDVDDHGPGVPEAARALIFERFRQAHAPSHGGSHGGAGLGLAIARELARAMGGDVDLVDLVDNVAGRGAPGARFRLTVALPRAATATTTTTTTTTSTKTATRWRRPPLVLIAEDVAVNRLVLTRILQMLGCEVAVVDDGAKAVEHTRRSSPDAVCMDCEMPVLDGVGATRALRALGITTPIFAATAHVLPDNDARCREAGMTALLHKPVEVAQVDALLRQHLRALLVDDDA